MRTTRTRHRARPAMSATVLATAISLAVTGTAIASPDAAPATPAAARVLTDGSGTTGAPTSSTVTLLTGDVATVTTDADGRQAVTMTGPTGPETVFEVYNDQQGHLHAIPESAQTLVAEGTLDQGLFDLTQLIADGYHDAGTGDIPVIVDYADKPAAGSLKSRAEALPGTDATTPVTALGAIGAKVDKDKARGFLKAVAAGSRAGRDAGLATSSAAPAGAAVSKIDKVWLDGKVRASLDVSVPLVGAPQAWAAGFDGKGVKVAVLDTGVDLNHPDVKDRVVATQSFVAGVPTVQDGNGHGTHVASTIAGSGAASGGTYKGVAPQADLLIGKVLSDSGNGTDSSVLAGMQWGAANADIVSMSLGGGPGADGTDPLSQAVNELSASTGALFVIAAGNAGSADSTIAAPGAAASALTVGAYSKTDTLASFSSRGPLRGNAGLKPDIAAPGVNIVAARAAGTTKGTPVNESYTSLNGTSMATPHVAGAAAILAQRHPDWSWQRLKDALMSSSKWLDGSTPYQQGAGRLDVAKAVNSHVTATGQADFGLVEWADGTRPSESRTITYTNSGDQELVLSLAVQAGAQDAFSLSASQVTVPAGGTAAVELTLDPNKVPAKGDLGGTLTATAGDGTAVHSVIAAVVEGDQHGVVIDFKDRNGTVPDYVSITLQSDDGEFFQNDKFYKTATKEFRVPSGRYSIIGLIRTVDGPITKATDLFSVPSVDLSDGDRTVTVDATKAKDFSLSVTDDSRPLDRSSFSVALRRHVVEEDGYGVMGVAGSLHWDSMKFGAIPVDDVPFGTLGLQHWETVRQPIVRASVDGQQGEPIEALVPTESGRFEGTKRLELVSVGRGAEADYTGKDVTGKAVLVEVANPSLVGDQVRLAVAKGAGAVFTMRDEPGAIRTIVPAKTPIPALAVDYEQGSRLLELAARGPVMVRLDGVAESTYTYQGHVVIDGIPSDLAIRAAKREFAVEKAVFHSDQATRRGFETRHSWDTVDNTMSTRAGQYITQPVQRTDYVLADPDVRYQQTVNTMEAGGDTLVEPVRTLKAGVTNNIRWYDAPSHPSVYSPMPCSLCRTDTGMTFIVAAQGDSDPTHYSPTGPIRTWSTYRNGERITDSTKLLVPEPAEYRFVLDTRRGSVWAASDQKLSPTTHTEWTFRSQAPTTDAVPGCLADKPGATLCEALPIMHIGYRAPVDTYNRTGAGETFTFAVNAVRSADYRGSVPVVKATVQVSYDNGATWQDAVVTGGSKGRYEATVRHPKLSATDGFVSIRTTVEDADGNRTVQVVNHAYGLK
ncbi:S8 family serine peptidase [Streptomyces sp. NPDC051940]|uniref:S8 family serine peptidase n=1 Tax=Streptomyces sp. NPDC051940 TaxID=3155675 RepID=UPI0034182475